MNSKQILMSFLCAIALATPSLSLASGAPKEVPQQQLGPATRYSGSTPIDLSHGLPFNNGTYGERNTEYEEWAKAPIAAPAMSEKPYPYLSKKDFINAINENIRFFEAAIFNWEQTSETTLQEAKDYSKEALTTLQPAVEKLKDATKIASSAGSSDWSQAESQARQALLETRGVYQGLHKNVR